MDFYVSDALMSSLTEYCKNNNYKDYSHVVKECLDFVDTNEDTILRHIADEVIPSGYRKSLSVGLKKIYLPEISNRSKFKKIVNSTGVTSRSLMEYCLSRICTSTIAINPHYSATQQSKGKRPRLNVGIDIPTVLLRKLRSISSTWYSEKRFLFPKNRAEELVTFGKLLKTHSIEWDETLNALIGEQSLESFSRVEVVVSDDDLIVFLPLCDINDISQIGLLLSSCLLLHHDESFNKALKKQFEKLLSLPNPEESFIVHVDQNVTTETLQDEVVGKSDTGSECSVSDKGVVLKENKVTSDSVIDTIEYRKSLELIYIDLFAASLEMSSRLRSIHIKEQIKVLQFMYQQSRKFNISQKILGWLNLFEFGDILLSEMNEKIVDGKKFENDYQSQDLAEDIINEIRRLFDTLVFLEASNPDDIWLIETEHLPGRSLHALSVIDKCMGYIRVYANTPCEKDITDMMLRVIELHSRCFATSQNLGEKQ